MTIKLYSFKSSEKTGAFQFFREFSRLVQVNFFKNLLEKFMYNLENLRKNWKAAALSQLLKLYPKSSEFVVKNYIVLI